MSDSPAEVLFEVTDGVAVVTLNAPQRRNALTPVMATELIATFDEVDARDDVGALVVRGVGRSFCAGGDVQTLTDAGRDRAAPAGAPAAPDAYAGMGAIYDSFYRLGQVTAPTIAAVRGSAVGAGMNLLLAADLRIVARDVRLLAGFFRRGMHPGGGHMVLLSRLIGRQSAAAMGLFGAELDGEAAVRLGLAWETLDDDAAEHRALELAARVATDPALARLTVANFRKETGPPGVSWEIATQFERPAQMWSMRRSTD